MQVIFMLTFTLIEHIQGIQSYRRQGHQGRQGHSLGCLMSTAAAVHDRVLQLQCLFLSHGLRAKGRVWEKFVDNFWEFWVSWQ